MEVQIKLHTRESVNKKRNRLHTFTLSGYHIPDRDIIKLDKSIEAIENQGLVPGIRRDSRVNDGPPLYWFTIPARGIPEGSSALNPGSHYKTKIGFSQVPSRDRFVNIEFMEPLQLLDRGIHPESSKWSLE